MRESDKPNVLPRRRVLQAASLAAAAPLARPFIANAKPRKPSRSACCWPRPATSPRRPNTWRTAPTSRWRNATTRSWASRPNWSGWTSPPRKAHSRTCNAGAGEQGRCDPRRLAQLQRPGRASHRRATENSVRVQQRRRHRDQRRELQPLHLPAEHAGGDAGGDVRALHHGLRQEVVFHHRRLRVRPGHRQIVQGNPRKRPAAPSSATTACR